MVASVYFNLHKLIWSIKDSSSGLVVAHKDVVTLHNAYFVVGEKGRQRVLKERKKNVHAYARGTLAKSVVRHTDEYLIKNGFRQAYYNPFKTEFFVDKVSGKQLLDRYIIHLRSKDRSVWYKPMKSKLI